MPWNSWASRRIEGPKAVRLTSSSLPSMCVPPTSAGVAGDDADWLGCRDGRAVPLPCLGGERQCSRAWPARRLVADRGGWPGELGDEFLDAAAELLAQGADFVEWSPGGVGDVPVEVADAWHVGAGVAAAHGDDHVGGADQLGGPGLGRAGAGVDADLGEGRGHFRLDRLAGLAARRPGVDAAGAGLLGHRGGELAA